MTFTLLIWNIWLKNQLGGKENPGKLLDELGRIVTEYQPDFIGLNEVLKDTEANSPFVFDYLKDEHGYEFNHFAAASPWNGDFLIGVGFCSKTKPVAIENITINKDTPATKRGYKGCTVKAIRANVEVGEKELSIITAHPLVLRPDSIRDHYGGTKTLENLVRKEAPTKNIILGGDFNEPGFMPSAFKHKIADVMHMRTGAAWDTTWRLNGIEHVPIRANLDQLYWTKDSDLTLKKFEVLETNISDHRPMIAVFSLD